MGQLLIRDLDAEVIMRLKDQARRNGRSLQGEAKAILEEAAAPLTTAEAQSFLRLAGAVSGPGDLSSRKGFSPS